MFDICKYLIEFYIIIIHFINKIEKIIILNKYLIFISSYNTCRYIFIIIVSIIIISVGIVINI